MYGESIVFANATPHSIQTLLANAVLETYLHIVVIGCLYTYNQNMVISISSLNRRLGTSLIYETACFFLVIYVYIDEIVFKTTRPCCNMAVLF